MAPLMELSQVEMFKFSEEHFESSNPSRVTQEKWKKLPIHCLLNNF